MFDFKAGRVEFDPTTGEARPLPGQGRVSLSQSSEDPELLGMQWLPRGSNSSAKASEELLILPGDVNFSKVPYCDSGRVVEMQFDSSGERHFFWLQDAAPGDLHVFSEADEEIIKKANDLVNSFNDEEENAMSDDAMLDAES